MNNLNESTKRFEIKPTLVDISDRRGLAGKTPTSLGFPLASIFAATASVSLVDTLQSNSYCKMILQKNSKLSLRSHK